MSLGFMACDKESIDLENVEFLGPYPGSKILGNGTFCLSASGLPRDTLALPGIQTLYLKDYTRNFVNSIRLDLKGVQGPQWLASSSDPFFAEATQWKAGSLQYVTRLYALPDPNIMAFVWEGEIVNTGHRKISFYLEPIFDFSRPSTADYGETKVQYFVDEFILTVGFTNPQKNDIEKGYFSRSITLAPSERHKFSLLVTISENQLQGLHVWDTLAVKDLRSFAQAGWEAWLAEGEEPSFVSREDSLRFRANLVSVKALTLNGAVPADITGQFVTNGLPQLYPRDAFMTARMFLETGHLSEVRQILCFWENVPYKETGEWFARYDAFGSPTEGGSGARYDVPEWDSNGYYTTLVYDAFLRHHIWIGDFQRIQELLNFVELRLSSDGLLYEGGIVEWEGFLPSTNMSLAAAFKQAAFMATWRNEKNLSSRWLTIAKSIDKGLERLFDPIDKTYKDLRHNTYAWNTSALFGWIWGYEDHQHLQLSTEYWWNHCRKMENGIQYFDSEGYGDDLFGFTTAAMAQYYAAHHRSDRYLPLKTWLDANTNIYGLMPERIYYPSQDGKISEASPLTWCSAEYVMALLEGSRHLMLSEDIQQTEKLASSLCQNVLSAQIPLKDSLSREACVHFLKDPSFWQNNFCRDKETIEALLGSASLKRAGISVNMGSYPLTLLNDTPFDIPFRISLTQPVSRIHVVSKYATPDWLIETPSVNEKGKYTVRVIPSLSLPVSDHFGYFLVEWNFYVEDLCVPILFPIHYHILSPYKIFLKDSLVVNNPVFFGLNRSDSPIYLWWDEDSLSQTLTLLPGFEDEFVIPFPDTANWIDSLHLHILYHNEEYVESFTWIPCWEIDLSEGWEFNPIQQVNQCYKLEYQDSFWNAIPVPAFWEDVGFPTLNGTYWYRKVFSLPHTFHNHRIWLDFGGIDDEDETFINCDRVGTTAGWTLYRRYQISPGKAWILWNKNNFIHVKVTDLGDKGGIYKGPVRFLIEKTPKSQDVLVE